MGITYLVYTCSKHYFDFIGANEKRIFTWSFKWFAWYSVVDLIFDHHDREERRVFIWHETLEFEFSFMKHAVIFKFVPYDTMNCMNKIQFVTKEGMHLSVFSVL